MKKTILIASLFAIITGMIFVPVSGMANVTQPVELSGEFKQEIKDRTPKHLQEDIEEFFTFAKQKHESTSDSEKQQLDQKMKELKTKMSETVEKHKKTPKDNRELRVLQDTIENIQGLPIDSTMVGNNKLTILLQDGNENQGWEEIIGTYIHNKNLNVEIVYGTVTLTEWSLRQEPEPALFSEINDKTPKEKHKATYPAGKFPKRNT